MCALVQLVLVVITVRQVYTYEEVVMEDTLKLQWYRVQKIGHKVAQMLCGRRL